MTPEDINQQNTGHHDAYKERFSAILKNLPADYDAKEIKDIFDEIRDAEAAVPNVNDELRELREENLNLREKLEDVRKVYEGTGHFLSDFFTAQKIVKAIHSTYNIDSFCNIFIEILSQYIPVKEYGVYIIEDAAPVLIYPDEIDDAFHEYAMNDWDDGIVEWVLREGRPIVIDNLRDPEADPANSFLLAPMLVAGQPIGFFKVLVHKSKLEFTPLELNIISFLAGQAALALSNVRLISDLTSTKDFLQNLMDTANDLIVSFDSSGRISFINRAVENYGFLREKLIGESLVTIFDSEKSMVKLLSVRDFPSQVEVVITSPNGNQYHSICTLSGILDLEGELKEYLGVFKDVTSRRMIEDKKLESGRLAAVAETAITINHELNNPMTIIMGRLYMVQEQARKLDDSSIAEGLTVIDKNFRRIINIVKRLQTIQEVVSTQYFEDLNMIDLFTDDSHSG